MPAYFIVDARVTDPGVFQEYARQAEALIIAAGGKYLAQGGETISFSSDWKPERVVIIEFPSVERANALFNSPEYRAIAPLRERSAAGRAILVEGLVPGGEVEARPLGKTLAVIQARMGSSRLPGKTLMTLEGLPTLEILVRRLERVNDIHQVVVATTDQPGDDPVATFCEREGIACFRGSENDVLDRFYQAAKAYDGQTLLRLTADCPFLSPRLCQDAIGFFRKHPYAYIHTGDTVPEGLGVEIFTFDALDAAWREATLRTDREHMTMFIFRHPNRFPKGAYELPENDSCFRVVLDDQDDLQALTRLANQFRHRLFEVEWPEIKEWLTHNPGIAALNAGKARFEGYQKAWAEENPGVKNPRTEA